MRGGGKLERESGEGMGRRERGDDLSPPHPKSTFLYTRTTLELRCMED